jgi:hypothetical protein
MIATSFEEKGCRQRNNGLIVALLRQTHGVLYRGQRSTQLAVVSLTGCDHGIVP